MATQAQQLEQATTQLGASATRINTLSGDMDKLSRQLTEMDTAVEDLMSLRADMKTVQTALNSGDSTLLGMVGRLDYLEESMESVNAHRLQINETLYRLQENLEAIQRQATSSGAVECKFLFSVSWQELLIGYNTRPFCLAITQAGIGYADVAELVDALDLGSSIARCGSSSLPIRTKPLSSNSTLNFKTLLAGLSLLTCCCLPVNP